MGNVAEGAYAVPEPFAAVFQFANVLPVLTNDAILSRTVTVAPLA